MPILRSQNFPVHRRNLQCNKDPVAGQEWFVFELKIKPDHLWSFLVPYRSDDLLY